MKRLIFLFWILVVVSTYGANPAFTDFNTNQFSTIGNKVTRINSWTNNGTFLYPAGTLGPSNYPAPPILIRRDGSTFIGSNLFKAVALTNFNIVYPLNAVSLTTSNDPPQMSFQLLSASSQNFEYYGWIPWTIIADKDVSLAQMQLSAAITNGAQNGIVFATDPSGTHSGTLIAVSSNFVERFKINGIGDITKIKGVTGYSWPTAHAAGALTNDGSGGLGFDSSLTSAAIAGKQVGSAVLTNIAAGANITNVSHSPLQAGEIAITNGGLGLDRGFKSLTASTMITLTDEGTNIIITGTGQTGNAILTNLVATKAVTNITITVITNTGVSLYTTPAGATYLWVECLGGGGGGGGVDGVNAQSAAAGGGGSGAYCATNITTPAASYIVTVGTNGLGGAAGANTGTIGGTTLFTNILTATGGSGGVGKAAAAAVSITLGGAGATQTATGKIYTGGNSGANGFCVSAALAISGGGAGSMYGGGGAAQTAAVGENATGKGAGGSGAAVITNADRAGGNGSPGIIIVKEFYQ